MITDCVRQKILIVDDESRNLDALESILESMPGLRLIRATDANDALYTARAIQEADLKGQASSFFDLSGLRSCDIPIVRFEGWIVGHRLGSQP